jgi:hypothetical protein
MAQLDHETLVAINWLDRSQLQALLESAGFAVYDSEPTDDLREAVRVAVEDGDLRIQAIEEAGRG